MIKGKTIYYPNNHNLNKVIYAFGLNGFQWMMVFGGILLFGIILFLKAILLIIAIPGVIVLIWFIGKVRKENRKGNPDYMGAVFVYMSTPKYLSDSTQVFKRIKQNGKRL